MNAEQKVALRAFAVAMGELDGGSESKPFFEKRKKKK